MSYTIQQTDRNGIGTVQSLVALIWYPTYKDILSEEQITYMLERMYATETLLGQMEQEGHVFLLLSDGAQPLGFAAYQCDHKEPGTSKLHKIYLLPETQGRGLGKLLLNAVSERVKAAGQQRLLLNVNRYNKAVDFYKKYGFSVIGEEDIDIGNGYFMNDFLMELKLS
jgi:GNAT superfamily N-acetyltransferase